MKFSRFKTESMRRWQRFGLMLSTAVLVVAQVVNVPAMAYTQQDYKNNQAKQDELKAKISETKGKEKTLSSQIAQMNNQISLNELELADTQGQIQSTQNLLVQVNNNIDEVGTKIERLDDTIGQMQEAADQRIKAAYKKSRMPSISAIISAVDFKQAMKSLAYIKEMEEQDNILLAQIGDNRKNYEEQKQNLANLKAEKESLATELASKQKQVQSQQEALSTAKANKDKLLAATRGDESVYQRLLAQAKAEAAAMASAIVSSNVKSWHVNRGDVIAFEGNTGCATGYHLHFSYRRTVLPYIGGTIGSGQWINPAPYIASGELGKPIAGYPSKISQHFGETAIAGLYGPDGHPGIDIADAPGTPILAAQSGTAVRWSDGGCRLGGVQTDRGEGIIITADDGRSQTLYWHIQR